MGARITLPSQSRRLRRGTFFSGMSGVIGRAPHILVECLAGDFQGELQYTELLANSGLDVYAHNVETVEALTPQVRDRRATFRQSLSVLEAEKAARTELITKTSIMLGLGETEEQVWETLRELRKINVDVALRSRT